MLYFNMSGIYLYGWEKCRPFYFTRIEWPWGDVGDKVPFSKPVFPMRSRNDYMVIEVITIDERL